MPSVTNSDLSSDLPVTYGPDADVAAASAAWRETIRGFLAHAAQTPVSLAATLEAAPRFALAHMAKGFFLLLLGRRELIDAARASYRAAAADAAALTPRERAYLEALALYVDGRMAAAADRLEAILADRPDDALAFKLVHAIRFVLGDSRGMRASAERAIDAYAGGHPYEGYAKGCLAFALEETGDYARAEAIGRAASALAADDAWGVHAVAHVLDMSGRSEEGVAWLAPRPGAWAHCNNFGYHVWWHLALFHIDRGAPEEALRLYDEEVRAEHTDDYRDIANGASLLMRLEFEGLDVGARWRELAELSARRVDDRCVVFADLHYQLALGGAGDKAAEEAALIRAMRANAETGHGCQAKVAGAVGAPCAEGLAAFAHGDYASAYHTLNTALRKLPMVGGSHAQRDVFDRTTIEAALRAGLLDEAEAAIQARIRRRGAADGYAERRLDRIAELRGAAMG